MAKKVQSKFMKELSSWAKPTKGIVFTPGKAVYSLAKTAFRHPYITLAANVDKQNYEFQGYLEQVGADTQMEPELYESKAN